jgi:hypothetical protein
LRAIEEWQPATKIDELRVIGREDMTTDTQKENRKD